MPKTSNSNKAGKKCKAKKAATTIVAQSHRASRAAGKLLGEGSNRSLCGSLTKGVIPKCVARSRTCRTVTSWNVKPRCRVHPNLLYPLCQNTGISWINC